MVYLYSGTPGSGKSYQATVRAIRALKNGNNVICNYKLNLSYYKNLKGNFTYLDIDRITPKYLVDYAKKNHKKRREGQTLLIIDECSIIFNSRDFNRADRKDWLIFFSQHRKLCYNVLLITQQDRALDRQIRGVIEYNYIHRKLSNFGLKGFIIRFLTGKNFLCREEWYPVREKIGAHYFNTKKKYYRAYDTFDIFEEEDINEKNNEKSNNVKLLLSGDDTDDNVKLSSAES